jgi:hypothetical protein
LQVETSRNENLEDQNEWVESMRVVKRTAYAQPSREFRVGIKLNKVHVAPQMPALTADTTRPIVLGMSRALKYTLLSLLLVNFTIAGVSNAAAYLDPGTGSIVFQSAIAAVATGVAVFASAWKSVSRFVGRIFNGNAGKDPDKK